MICQRMAIERKTLFFPLSTNGLIDEEEREKKRNAIQAFQTYMIRIGSTTIGC